ncbi:MAG TPA: CAP domain-containing protein [Candidatus Saccharimonadales bacterium]|nr:CAP domain-containing protein [Candidatus Saccharimonadales bacterium]
MAKIKTPQKNNHHTRPRGTAKHNFEKVYWPYIPIIIAIALLLPLASSGGALKAAFHNPGGRVLSYATSMSINQLLADTNAQRVSNGVAPLSLNDKLDAAAQANADDMAARNYWSHYTPEGSPPWTWVTDQSYSYQKLGQNLAAGFSDEQATINGWMASAPHRENLLDSAFSDVGFGYANNPDYTSAGGGPMTIVVAFYGQPQVLGSSTSVGSAAAGGAQQPSPPADQNPIPNEPAAQPTAQPVAKTPPTTTQTAAKNMPKPKATTNLQLAAPRLPIAWISTTLSALVVAALLLLWASRHLRALHRVLRKGEVYAVRHPLTDIGLIVIAALLFILSQTAGLVQ